MGLLIDREKTMQWLETCVSGCEEGCPYEYKNLVYRVECKADLMRDALDLLKEQEAVEPKVIGTNSFGDPVHACGKCGMLITESMNYCYGCGKRIKWEGR